MERSVVMERDFAHPPERVWRALTEQDLIEVWLMKTTLEPKVGAQFEFRAEPSEHWDGVVRGEVLEVEPFKRLSYRWDSGKDLRTIVTWTLEAIAAGTRVRMEQHGFTAADERNFRGAQFGWPKLFDALSEALDGLDS